ncbi:uncharacterized protein LOC112600897 [Melanaphis sacchari]|uniref:uncharacterized protein LOC112600897 n=1 Tax=Melanaphis sacchari TaxID=742174 RepID=UPI000DC14F66|nr:uncharacterized protein LOC112600897 [Melanaphis sacchari]
MSDKNKDTRSQSKKIIYDVYKFFKNLSEKPDLTADFFKRAQEVTAQACRVSTRTVTRICCEASKSVNPQTHVPSPSFKSPRKSYKRAKILTELDDYDASIVGSIVHDIYDNGEYPLSSIILNTLREKINYTGSIKSVHRILKHLNFSFKKCTDGRNLLMEHTDIVAQRCIFLRKMCTMRTNKDSHPVVYVGETWINRNHPTAKEGGVIVCYAGCTRQGFIKNSKLVICSNTGNSIENNCQMNAEVYKQWFLTLLDNIEEPSVIIMGNASYSLTLSENYPKCNSIKADVQKWLTDKKIPYSPLETLAELKIKVKNTISREKSFHLDQLALKRGHEVIRFPPYYHQYNPLELIWAQVKDQVKKLNNNFNIVEIERLTHAALDSMTVCDWDKCVQQAEAVQSQAYEKEIRRDTILEPMIRTILPDNNDYSGDEDADNDEDLLFL